MTQPEHLDLALAEEFAGHGETIHKLKVSNPRFRQLMVDNHALWSEIHNIQAGIQAAAHTRLEELHKQRLKLLDEIAGLINAAES